MKTLFLSIILSINIFANQITTIKVEAMHCPLCTVAVKKSIKKLPGIVNVSVRLNTKNAVIEHKESTSVETILNAIKETTYEGIVVDTKIQ